MSSGLRTSFLGVVLLVCTALGATGCDAGGLMVAEGKEPQKAPLKGHSSTEMVSGGTLAKNSKYKMVYVLGQPSPQQGVATGADGQRLNGGLTGAVQGK